MNLVGLLAAGIAGAATLFLVIAVLGGQRRGIASRLAIYDDRSAGQLEGAQADRRNLRQIVADSAALARLNRTFERRSWSEQMASDLARADLALRPIEYILMRIAVVLVFVIGALALGSTVVRFAGEPLALVLVALAGLLLPGIYVGRRQARRLRAFNSRLADTITLIANSLRSGSSFLQAISLVVRENEPPVSTEFDRVIREVNLGQSLEHALQSMVRRVRSDDLELMVTAISIQHQVGGNLAEILDTISYTIRERVRIKAEIRTLTAMQRLSGYVVGFLPVGLFLGLFFVAPDFMSPMFESPPEVVGLPLGVILLSVGVLMMATGFMFVRRLVDIDI